MCLECKNLLAFACTYLHLLGFARILFQPLTFAYIYSCLLVFAIFVCTYLDLLAFAWFRSCERICLHLVVFACIGLDFFNWITFVWV